MLYRIFRKQKYGPYALTSGKEDVTVKGSYQHAAVEWAKKYAPESADELDLLVSRLGLPGRIESLRRVVLRKVPPEPPTPTWAIVTESTEHKERCSMFAATPTDFSDEDPEDY